MRSAEDEANRLSEVLCFGSSSDVTEALEQLNDENLNEACTTITASGHTVVHVLAQRQKAMSLQAVLKRGVDVNTRNAQGITPIHLALQHNALSSAKILINHGASVSEIISRRKGTTLLHMFVMCDRPQAVRLLLAEGAEVDCRDVQDRTPLHLAAIYGNLRIADILLQHEGCNVNTLDGSGHTPLMLAILNGNAELARHLSAASKTDVSLRDRDGMSALHIAVAVGQVDIARAILSRNTANINSKERSMGRTPLHFACALTARSNDVVAIVDDSANRNGDVSCLISSATDNASSATNNTSANEDLHQQENNGALATNHNAGINNVDKTGNDAEEENNDTEDHISESTVTPASAIDVVTTNGDTQEADKHSASMDISKTKCGSTKKTKWTGSNNDVSMNAEPHNNSQPKALQNSVTNRRCSNGSPNDQCAPVLVKELQWFQASSKLRMRASLAPPYHERPKAFTDNQVSRRPATASSRLPSTWMASGKSRREFNLHLSQASMQSHRKDSSWRDSTVTFVLTPSNVGTVRCKMVALLLDNGADANLMTLFRKSALHIVAALGASDVMALLLPHTTNPNMLSASNKTALHLAVERGHTAIVSQLIHAGANLGLRDMSGMTALHAAAKLGHADMVPMLLKGGAEKNSSDFKQMTPLHHACQNGHTEVIDILLRAGCRTDLVDDQGVLALDYSENCPAEKEEEKQEDDKQEIRPGDETTVPNEVNPEMKRQRKKGAVYLPSPTLSTHPEV